MEVRSREFEALVEKAESFHGHLCSGLYIGVRMAVFAEKLLGIDSGEERFMVEMETDRCPADGVLVASSLSIGRRRVKMLDYGKCAARFYDARTGKGVRLRFASNLIPAKGDDIVEFFSEVEDGELFRVEEISKEYQSYDLPGPMIVETICADCGEPVQDHREIECGGRALCKPCYEKRAMTSSGMA